MRVVKFFTMNVFFNKRCFVPVNRTEVWTISGQGTGVPNRDARISLDNFIVVDGVQNPGYKSDRTLPPPYSERKYPNLGGHVMLN